MKRRKLLASCTLKRTSLFFFNLLIMFNTAKMREGNFILIDSLYTKCLLTRYTFFLSLKMNMIFNFSVNSVFYHLHKHDRVQLKKAYAQKFVNHKYI